MMSSTAVVQERQDGDDEKKCSRCGRSVDGGNFVERRNGEGTLCVDCLLMAINWERLVLVDPTGKNGLRCHKCNVEFKWCGPCAQSKKTGVLLCVECSRPKYMRRYK